MKRRIRKEKKRFSRKQLYLISLGALIILIMVGGALDLGSVDEEDVYEYKGLKFVQANEGWLTYLPDGRKVFILNNPAELENMTINYIELSRLNMLQKIYISTNPEERVRNALMEFYREIQLRPLKVPACTVDVPKCAELPIRTCNDTSETVGVIIFREANETNVELGNNCLVIEGKYPDKVVDKLIMEQL